MNYTPFDEMERMFDEMRRSFWTGSARGTPRGGRFGAGSAETNLNVERTDEGFVVHVDLPGYERQEIDLRLDDRTLTIEAAQERENDYSVSSRRVHEEVTLPAEVLEDEIEASYHNGVLEVRLPSVPEIAEEDDDAVHIDIE